MILEFLDKSQLDVLSIFGGPRLINGVMRDTLRIEVSPSIITFDELKASFKDNPKTATLYTYSNIDDPTIKHEAGVGYMIFVSITDEERRIISPPGKMVPDEFEEVFIITIAQMTYQEYQKVIPPSEE